MKCWIYIKSWVGFLGGKGVFFFDKMLYCLSQYVSVPTFPFSFLSSQEEAKAAEKRKEGGPRPTDPGDSTPANETPQKAVSIRGIVGPRHGGIEVEAAPELREVRSNVPRTRSMNDISVSSTTFRHRCHSERLSKRVSGIRF